MFNFTVISSPGQSATLFTPPGLVTIVRIDGNFSGTLSFLFNRDNVSQGTPATLVNSAGGTALSTGSAGVFFFAPQPGSAGFLQVVPSATFSGTAIVSLENALGNNPQVSGQTIVLTNTVTGSGTSRYLWTSPIQYNYGNFRGAWFFLNVTAVTGAVTGIQLRMLLPDPITLTLNNIWASTNITSVSENIALMCPGTIGGLGSGVGTKVNARLPAQWAMGVFNADSTGTATYTFNVSSQLMP